MNISEALREVENCLKTASEVKEEIKERGGEIIKENPYPPIWSNKTEDIPIFLKSIKEWIEDPILRKVEKYISMLKRVVSDKRDFKYLPREYLLDIGDILKDGVEKITHIEIDSLKMNATKYILDNLIQQQEKSEVEGALRAIENYHSSLQEKIISFDCKRDTFLETIKNDVKDILVQTTNFEKEEMKRYYQSMEQAKRGRDLLKNTVSENAFVKEYETMRDINKIWSLANSINEILGQTKAKKEEYKEEGEKYPLLVEYETIKKQKKNALLRPSLTDIKKELENYKNQVSSWLDHVNSIIQDKQEKFRHLEKLLQQYQNKASNEIIDNLNEITNKEIKFESISDVSLDKLAGILQCFDGIERRAEGTLKGLLNDEERKVIEGGDELEKLQIKMGEKLFWRTLRGVIQKVPALTIKLKWRKEK